MSLLTRTELIASYYTLNGVAGPARLKPNVYTFEQRATAARDAGFTGIGLTIERDEHRPGAELAAVAADIGIAVPELEFVAGWFLEGQMGEESIARENRLYELADAFQSRQLNAGIIVPRGELPAIDMLARRFGELCDRAAEHGLVVSLEPFWVSALTTPAQAQEIVELAGRANGGVLIDAYHFFRSPATLEDLSEVPAELINGVQLDDVPAEQTLSDEEENEHGRALPGEGVANLVGFLTTLDGMGVDVPLAIEMMSDDLRAEPLEQAARHSFETTSRVVAAARAAAYELK